MMLFKQHDTLNSNDNKRYYLCTIIEVFSTIDTEDHTFLT